MKPKSQEYAHFTSCINLLIGDNIFSKPSTLKYGVLDGAVLGPMVMNSVFTNLASKDQEDSAVKIGKWSSNYQEVTAPSVQLPVLRGKGLTQLLPTLKRPFFLTMFHV